MELTSPGRPRLKRRPFYQPYNFGQDYFGPESRTRIADFLEASGQAEVAERYRACKREILLLKCSQEDSSRCTPKKYVDPYEDDRTQRRGYFIARSQCRSRVCEPCARAFGNKFRRKVRPFLRALYMSDRRRGFKHLVLTFRRTDEEITPEWIRAAFKKAGKLVRRFYHEKNEAGEFISGALAVMEMSPEGFFHIHCLVYGKYVPIEDLSAAWIEITGDSYRVAITDAQGRSKYYPSMSPDRALNEVTKYIKKPVSTPFLEEMFRYITAIKGRRRVHTWGIFYNHPELRPPRHKSRCPFCSGSVVLVATYEADRAHEINDGTYWPTWAVLDGLLRGRAPMRYD